MPPTARKSNPEQQRALLEKYNISVEGPVRPRDWPEKYSSIFALVRDAEKVRYEDYYRTDVGNDLARLLQELVSRAYNLRMSSANEETWRMETEDLILQRFKAEVDCHMCNNRRWLTDMQALPSCPLAAEKLKRIRSTRSLCRCEEPARGKWLNKVLAHHKPDRVISLERTHDIKRLLPANDDITPTVIKNDMDSCFPFLVVEAKSEKGTVGFDSIERQTAFPIRAMLDIQKRLETAGSGRMRPLRIIDLWHGCILRHDSSLQLLLIIDLICDWARGILTEQVMSSLRRRAGPDYSIIASSSTLNEVVLLEPSLSCNSSRSRTNTPRLDIHEDAQKTGARSEVDIRIEADSSPRGVPAILLNDSAEASSNFTLERAVGRESTVTTADGTETHEYDIKLLFRHVSLPEFAYGLHDILRVMGSADTVETARKLLSLFNRNDPFVVEPGYINRLRKAWGEDSEHELQTARNLYVCLVWRARFDYQSWTLIKELSCITASKEAIEALAAAGKVSTVSNEFRRKPEASTRAIRLIHPVRYLPVAEVVQAAARNQWLYLQASRGHAGPHSWTEDQSKAAMFQYFWDCFDSQHHAFTECSGPADIRGSNAIKAFLEEGHGCLYGNGQQLSAANRRALARWASVLMLMQKRTVKRRRYF
ncbi:hypothetical protein BJX62DRAFT_228223 [Aspergillus germanicus]